MKRWLLKYLLLCLFLQMGEKLSYCQPVPQGFSYQTTVRNASGTAIANQAVSLRFSFYSGSSAGTLVWQEDHSLSTDSYGHLVLIIGTGQSHGAGAAASFSQVNWGGAIHYLKVSLDASGGSTYTDLGNSQLFSVPYALRSFKTGSGINLALADMNDANVTGIAAGKLLEWNGTYWAPAIDNDSDTVLYSYFAGHAVTSDSALYSYVTYLSDSPQFAFQSDSA